jgi:hypothetical protein
VSSRRRLLASTSFGPDALKVIGEAFELAWADVATAFGTSLAQEAARLTIANAVLEAAAGERNRFDIERLRLAGQRAIALKYPAAIHLPQQRSAINSRQA